MERPATALDVSDAVSRFREHWQLQKKPVIAAEEARAFLSERRLVLDDVATIAGSAVH